MNLCTAVHEAGHTVMARSLGVSTYGYTEGEDYHAALLGMVNERQRRCISVAGAAAEVLIFGDAQGEAGQYRGDVVMGGFRSWRSFIREARRAACFLSIDAIQDEAKIALGAC